MKTTFNNLRAAIVAEYDNRLNEFIQGINEKGLTDILGHAYFNQFLTKATKDKQWANADELRAYLIGRARKYYEKLKAEKLAHIEAVENADDFNGATITVEWKRSQMWGSNPTATARVKHNSFSSGSIGGCGYDKESTATADALNQSKSFLKALYTVKEQRVAEKCENVLGYGSGYGVLPQLEGGVGVECMRDICKSIGFKWTRVSGDKSFDVYTITQD